MWFRRLEFRLRGKIRVGDAVWQYAGVCLYQLVFLKQKFPNTASFLPFYFFQQFTFIFFLFTTCLFIFVCENIYLSFNPSICLSKCMYFWLSLYVYLYIYVSIRLRVSLSCSQFFISRDFYWAVIVVFFYQPLPPRPLAETRMPRASGRIPNLSNKKVLDPR